MKKVLCLLALFGMRIGYGQTTGNKFDLSFSRGIYSHRYFREAKFNDLPAFPQVLGALLGGACLESSGITNAAISRRMLSNKMNVGLSFSYQRIKVRCSVADIPYESDVVAIMPFIRYNYYNNRGIINGYSGVAVGVGLLNLKTEYAKSRHNNLACQFTAFGLRAGNKIAVIIEGGYGYKGIVNLGFSARL